MTELLIRLFVKDRTDASSPVGRGQYGRLSGWVGVFCNLFLFLLKYLMGHVVGSIAIIGDGFNNLSDAGSGIVTYIGFRAAAQPADEDHPFGHGRIEYLSGLVITFFVFLVGFDVVKTAVGKILHPEDVPFHGWVLAALLLSVAVKLWLSGFYRKLAQIIDSSALKAAAQDSRNDVFCTAAAILGMVLSPALPFSADGWLGLAVGLFILYGGFLLAKETVGPLLGQKPDPDLVEQIGEILKSDDGIIGVHDLILHDYGPGRRMGSAHVEISRTEDPMQAHERIDRLEKQIQSRMQIPFVLHYDPVADDCGETLRLRQLVEEAVRSVGEEMSIHDFRIGEKGVLQFDVAVPPRETRENGLLKSRIDEAIEQSGKAYRTAITFDRTYL
ncbi:MAG: cation transporter [Oscillospiraceae bacterium]|nr:cation transporter [Oscillospiraceae bacterium]